MTGLEHVIPDHVRPARFGGVITKWHGDILLAYSSRRRSRLSPSAAYVWLLCDGLHTVSEIIERIKATYPRDAPHAADDVLTALASLRNEGLVSLSGNPRASHPLLRVAFANYRPDLPTDDNYFLWMLSHRFDVLISDPRKQAFDMLLFSDGPPAGGFDHRDVDTDAALKVFFSSGSHADAPEECDYAFIECGSRSGSGESLHMRLPFWATRLEWSADKSGEAAWHVTLKQKRASIEQNAQFDKEFFCAAYDSNTNRCDEVLAAFSRLHEPPVSIRSTAARPEEEDLALSRCKFVLLFEEPEFPGLVAERLLKALRAGIVPLVFGSRGSLQDFNPCAYVDAGCFDSVSSLIEFVNKLDNDHAAYRHFLAAPVFTDEDAVAAFSPARVCQVLYDSLFRSEEEALHPGNGGLGKTPNRRTSIPKLTIGMATYDDYDGVYFSVQAIRFYHPEVAEDTEILVIDNNPEGVCGDYLKNLEELVPGYRYIPYGEMRSTAVRDLVFREAAAEYVLCIDSHVFLEAGSIRRLIDYFDSVPDCKDLLQGPLLSDNLGHALTHFDPEWNQGMFGRWASDDRGQDAGNPPFEIPMQGLGVFACRKSVWPGFNPRFLGFGGEEGYIHEKFRQRGDRTLCLPFLRWLHRFNRPLGIRYENRWEDRFRNYFIGFSELGLNTEPIVNHFAECVSSEFVETASKSVQAELENPFSFFDAIYCINQDGATVRWENACRQFEAMGISHRIIRFPAIETPESHHIGCALSHRRIVQQAQRHGHDNVLVFEDDVVFIRRACWYLKKALDELTGRDWNLLYLGGHRWGKHFEFVDGCAYLKHPTTLTCTHAIAYHRAAYDSVLRGVPDTVDAMKEWILRHRGVDQYLMTYDLRYVTSPSVASQPSILGQEDLSHRDEFMIPIGA